MDHLCLVERLLQDGEAPLEDYQLAPGGSAANTIYALAKLGVSTGFVGAVGADAEGKVLLKHLEKVGTDISRIVTKPAPTGFVLGLSDHHGQRALYVKAGANSFLEETDLDWAYLKQARLLHLSSFVDKRQLELQKQVVASLPSTVEISLAPSALYAALGLKALASLVARASFLFLNRDELRALTGQGTLSGARACLKLGCRQVIVTLGKGVPLGQLTAKAEGEERDKVVSAYAVESQGEFYLKAEKRLVRQVEGTGAGDAFAAGFLFGYLRGQGPEECAYLGQLLARGVLRKPGARAGLPSLAQVRQSFAKRFGRAL